MIDAVKKIETERRYLEREILSFSKRLGNLWKLERTLSRIAALPASEDVETAQLYNERIDLNLKEPASFLPRQIVREFGVKLTKRASYTNLDLVVEGEIDGILLVIGRYKPETCTVTYEDVEMPAQTVRKAKITCTPSEITPETPETETTEETV